MELNNADERSTRNAAKRMGYCDMNEKPLSKTPKMQIAATMPLSSHVRDENQIDVIWPKYTAIANAKAAIGRRSEKVL